MGSTLKIAIIGYGKMGHAVESLAAKHDAEVVSIIDPSDRGAMHNALTRESLDDADAAIDFSSSAGVMKNIKDVTRFGKDMVVGTTGWYDNLPEVRELVKGSGTGLVYSPNFSIGVNVFFQIVRNASALFDRFPGYDPFVYEMHHNQKTDAPGGTAKHLGEIILENVKRKKRLAFDRINGRKIEKDELHVGSIRAGYIPGVHVAGFDGEADTIELRHTARDRSGFAEGALFAANWVKGRKGVYSLEDILTKGA